MLTLLRGLKTFATYVLLSSLDYKPLEEKLCHVSHLAYSCLDKYYTTFIIVMRFQNYLKSLKYVKPNSVSYLSRFFSIFPLLAIMNLKFLSCLNLLNAYFAVNTTYKMT